MMNFEGRGDQKKEGGQEQFVERESSLLGKFRERLGGKMGRGLLSALRLGTMAWMLSQESAHAHENEQKQQTYEVRQGENQENEEMSRAFLDVSEIAAMPRSDENDAYEKYKTMWEQDPVSGLKNFEHFYHLKEGKAGEEFLDWLLKGEEDEVSLGFPRAGFAYAGYEFYKNHPQADAIFQIAEQLVKGGLLFHWKLPKDELRAMEDLAQQHEQTKNDITAEIEKLNQYLRERAEEDTPPFTW